MTDQPEKLDLRSFDITAEKQAALRAAFPEAFTEGGKVDFDRLKLALGEMVDAGKERYGMSWPGKAECFRTIQQPSMATLVPAKEESVEWDTTENLIIEGDNLEVLKLLQKSYLGKVKMIYIDPPYNTGNDFIYPDNYSESLDTYLRYTGQVDSEGRKYSTNTEADGRFHSKWMNMMYPRLYLARNLLRDDGVIFISIDDHEMHNLLIICNEIFGEENYLSSFIWNSRTTGGHDSKDINVVHEYIVCFGKSPDKRGEIIGLLDSGTEYPELDTRTNRSYKWDSFWTVSHGYTANCDYPIESPDGTNIWPWMCHNDGERVKGRARWFWSKETYDADKQELLVKKRGNDWKVYKKVYGGSGIPIQSIISKDTVGGTSEGKSEFEHLFEESGIFNNPKPPALINAFAMRMPEDSIILDFFSGSGTTAQAVLELNEEGGARKFVLVQLPESTERNDFSSIVEITKERVRRVIKNLNEKDAGKLGLERSGGKPDRGFKVFKLQSSNFKAWDADVPKESAAVAQQLEMNVHHLVDGRTQEDILFEILLKSGFPLTTPVKELKLADLTVYSIADGAMLICLEKQLSAEVINEMAALKPERVVCLDEGFAGNDQLKTNAVQTMKTKGVTSFRTV